MTPSELLVRWATTAVRDDVPCGGHGVKVHPSGRFSIDGARCTEDAALAHIAAQQVRADPPTPKAQHMTDTTTATAPAKGPKRTGFTWGGLNAATQGVFIRLCEDIQAATEDHSMAAAARLAVDIPKINPIDAPRITNCKKAGLLETLEGDKKSHKLIRLTDEGRRVWFEHTGNPSA